MKCWWIDGSIKIEVGNWVQVITTFKKIMYIV